MKTEYKHLTDKERYTIEFLIQQEYDQKDIAKFLNRDKSCISRELKRNRQNGEYNAETAIALTAKPRTPISERPAKVSAKKEAFMREVVKKVEVAARI